MQTTETPPDTTAREAAPETKPETRAAAAPAPEADARARARAYLDRWERHLVRVALDGPAGAGGRPTAG